MSAKGFSALPVLLVAILVLLITHAQSAEMTTSDKVNIAIALCYHGLFSLR